MEIQERLIANCGERFSSSVIWRFFDRHEITLKKRPRTLKEQQRPDVLKQRQAWFGAQLDLDPRKLVFIDETGASTNLARKSGRCRRGRRLRVGVAHGHYKTIRRSPSWPGCAFRPRCAEGFRPADGCRHVGDGRKSPPHALEGDVVGHGQSSSPSGQGSRNSSRPLEPSYDICRTYRADMNLSKSLLEAEGLPAQDCRRPSQARRTPRRLRRNFRTRRMRNYFKAGGRIRAKLGNRSASGRGRAANAETLQDARAINA